MISGIEEDKHRQWYYKDPGTESWQPFSKPDNKSINNGCGAGESDIQLTLKLGTTPSTEYTVDLSTMKMENAETGEMINLTSSRKRALMTDLLHGKEKEREDCRLTLLNEEPALYDELCETMLLLLFEVYRTSATPNVKYQCLHCLLRIIYHSRADTIRTMSETLPLSSTVAGMLTSQDSSVLDHRKRPKAVHYENLNHRSKFSIRNRYLGHVTGYQGPVFPDSAGYWM
eukprot:sb/3469489/